MNEELIEKVTDLICKMLVDFQSRTPDNPITRDDIRSYVEEIYLLEEDADDDDGVEGSTCSSPVIITIPVGACASTW
jgi:hypothetical protein